MDALDLVEQDLLGQRIAQTRTCGALTLLVSRGRVGELKSPFDALQAVARGVEPLLDSRDVGLDVHQVPLHRGHAPAEIPHVIPHRSYVGTDRTQMFENQVLGFSVHRMTYLSTVYGDGRPGPDGP